LNLLPRTRIRSGSKISSKAISIGSEDWDYDNVEEFFAEYANADSANLTVWRKPHGNDDTDWLYLDCSFIGTSIKLSGCSREEIARLRNVFAAHEAVKIVEEEAEKIVEEQPTETNRKPTIFIGHGRDTSWRSLKDHLQEKHSQSVTAFEIGERAGHTIRDILEDLLQQSSIAFLVLTAEDEQSDGNFRGRQNVVHECGLFQGRLGFSRGIILKEEETQGFSNLDGIQYISFKKGHIESTFGDVLAVLKREFGS
jgi:predicted nucleotide-binding protein